MIIGVPKEIKDNENRVALTPAGSLSLTQAGHGVLIEKGAGLGSGFSDADYQGAGATITSKPKLFATAEMIVKVKEPLAEEFKFFRPGQVLFTYLHLAPDRELTEALLKAKGVGIAYATIVGPAGDVPLLTPMSEIAGRMATQIGAQFLESPSGGKGVLLGGVPGVEPARVVIIGGGVVGTNAAKIALGLGARVVVLDKSLSRLRFLDDLFGGRVSTVKSNKYNIGYWVERADLVIGAVLVSGAKAPKLVSEEMVKAMQPGSVIVDVAIDQGGSFETIDHITTHSHPSYIRHGVIHYAVANMPGAVARTSTLALTNATIEYALEIANHGWARAARECPGLAKGVNLVDGQVTCPAVAEALGLEYVPLDRFLG